MAKLNQRDGKEISLDTNLPELPPELKQRLEDVIEDLRIYLKGRPGFLETGTILADEKGNRHILLDLDVLEFAVIYLENGIVQSIKKDGTFSDKWPVRSQPWSRQDTEHFDDNKGSGETFKILGKYVDYDR